MAVDAATALHVQLLLEPPGEPSVDGITLDRTSLAQFYAERDTPAWSTRGRPNGDAEVLLRTLAHADRQGLDPADYHLAAVRRYLDAVGDPVRLARLDVLLTAAALDYARDVAQGRVQPADVDPDWHIPYHRYRWGPGLAAALGSGTLTAFLRDLPPPYPQYHALQRALQTYLGAARHGGWEPIDAGPTLRRGDHGPRVLQLRRRLSATHDLAPVPLLPGADRYDDTLATAVRRFQLRHGLKADGTVGAATLRELNVSIAQRLARIRINLERWRWLPRDLGSRYLLVDIAGFRLSYIDRRGAQLVMAAAVGRPDRSTPVFSDRVTRLIFNPDWNVPTRIAVEDILPRLRISADYLRRNRFEVYEGWNSGKPVPQPNRIDWKRLNAQCFPYRLRQLPGAQNALGRLKFVLTNGFDIYLHDTPHQWIFTAADRAVTSGCVRLARPIELARLLLAPNGNSADDQIAQLLASDTTRSVRLPKPVPVHFVYFTVWDDATAGLQFRRDIYHRDPPLLAAFGSTSPDGAE